MKEIRALKAIACIAQSVERQPFKLVVVGSSPTVGVLAMCNRKFPTFFFGNSPCLLLSTPPCAIPAVWSSGMILP